MTDTTPTQAELVALVQQFAASDGVHSTRINRLQLIRISTPGMPLPALYEPGLVLVLVVQGRKRAVLGAERMIYDPLHCLVVAVTMLPVAQVIEASVARPYLCARVSMDVHEIGSLVLDAQPARPAGSAAKPTRGLHVMAVSPPLLDAMLRLLRLLQTPQDAAVLAPLFLREIFYHALTGALGPSLRELSVADSHAQRIARAIELLERRYAEPLRVEEVAQAAHMSPSSLHQHFKLLTTLSPLQYQKKLRLHHARRLMLGEGLDAAAAGHRVGYESASQFSREYRRLFGAPPRAEVQHLRSVVLSA